MGVLLRKPGGGADSFGHVWKTDKSVVEVTEAEAADLLAIADAGFIVVSDAVDTSTDEDTDEHTGEAGETGEPVEVTEPAGPEAEVTEPAGPEATADATGSTGGTAGTGRHRPAKAAKAAAGKKPAGS